MMRELPAIDRSYLLICPMPHYRDAEGAIWLDQLWHQDFVGHLRYLKNMILVSPGEQWSEGLDLVRLEWPDDGHLEVVAIPSLASTGQMIRGLPDTVATLWRSIGRAEVVQSGIAGWPFPLGWIANPIALIRRKMLLIVVESAPWRIPAGQIVSFKDRLREKVTEAMGRFFVNRADLALFTQPAYRESLMTKGQGKSVIIPATWIGEDDILSADEAQKSWDTKRGNEGLRVLFAGRLVAEKGIDVLLSALENIDRLGESIRVDVIGEGPQREKCIAISRQLKSVNISVLEPVPYGAEFFALVRQYHAIIVPSISDEQPRLVFDAFSQSVPVLASRTDGLTPHVIDNITGRLFEVGDVDSLARCLLEVSTDLKNLEELGSNGLEAASKLTHSAMHDHRWRILIDYFLADQVAQHQG